MKGGKYSKKEMIGKWKCEIKKQRRRGEEER